MSAKQKQDPNQILFYLAGLALLGLGVWLRARFIQTVQLYPDEFVTLLAVRMIGQKGLPLMPSGLFFDHGLLFSYAGSIAAWFGPPRLAVRYASLLFSLLTLGLTWWVGRRWFSPAVGLIAAAGLAIAPTAIQWGGRARMYALLQLLVLLTLWLAYEGIVRNQARRRWAALLAYLAATLAHFLAVALAPPLVLAATALLWRQTRAAGSGNREMEEKSRRPFAPLLNKQRGVELMAFIAILIFAFLIKRAGQPKGIEALEAVNVISGLGQVLAIYSDLSFNLVEGWQAISSFYLTLPALVFVPFVPLALIGDWPSGRWVKKAGQAQSVSSPPARLPTFPLSIFLTIILLATTLEMIFLVSPDRRDDKYLFMLLPVLLLLGAQGLLVVSDLLSVITRQLLVTKAASKIHNSQFTIHNSSLILSLLFSGLVLMATRPAVQALLANTGDDYDSAFAYVQAHWQPGDTILTGTPAAAAFYMDRNDFYSVQRQGGYNYRVLTVDGQQVDRWLASPAIRTEAALHQTLARHRVWLVLERWGLQREYYDLPFQQQLLAQTEHVGDSQGIFVLRSRPDPRPLALQPAQPVEAVFGERLCLTGYTLEPAQPAAGQTVRLTFYWQAVAPLSRDYTVFVHLRRPEGGNVAQADHRPLGSIYPTSLWPVGELIREANDDLMLPVDLPPGDYELWVGLYLLETGERLPVQNDASGENAVKLGRLEIGD
ncbi:MAG: glycosyltransferase family 39 protein [Chloroflexota bacterium]